MDLDTKELNLRQYQGLDIRYCIQVNGVYHLNLAIGI